MIGQTCARFCDQKQVSQKVVSPFFATGSGHSLTIFLHSTRCLAHNSTVEGMLCVEYQSLSRLLFYVSRRFQRAAKLCDWPSIRYAMHHRTQAVLCRDTSPLASVVSKNRPWMRVAICNRVLADPKHTNYRLH